MLDGTDASMEVRGRLEKRMAYGPWDRLAPYRVIVEAWERSSPRRGKSNRDGLNRTHGTDGANDVHNGGFKAYEPERAIEFRA